jgi:uracil phosphoribosyltransferase/phosphoserine phosphatase/adenylylsulfate kinase-like enzyme
MPVNGNVSSTMSCPKTGVIGLYGVPGSGKTTILSALKHRLHKTQFSFDEGSDVIASLVPGGLCGFQQETQETKTRWRQAAIEHIGKESVKFGLTAVVTGHFMFWSEGDEAGQTVYTQGDLDTYTHIIYLDTPSEQVAAWRQLDKRTRIPATAEHLRRWQEAEKTELRSLCRDNGILFMSVSDPTKALDKITILLLDFAQHTEEHNLSSAKDQLEDVISAYACREKLQTALVLDADGTLAAEDTGALFWAAAAKSASAQNGLGKDGDPLKTLFSGPMGYTYTAFRQAMLLYEEEMDEVQFDSICKQVASSVALHPEMVSLLSHAAAEHGHVAAVVITCGLRRVWEIVLASAGLSKAVKVMGGGRISDGFVMTPEVKRALVARMRDVHGLYVWAIGDSPLDLPMMHEAHQAIVVVGEKRSRSKTMDGDLLNAIAMGGLRARQVLLPSTAAPRLDTDMLPLMDFTDGEFLDAIVQYRNTDDRTLHATTRNAAKLLMTPTRDARISGPNLRKAHKRIGWYLATEFLAEVVGVDEYNIPHVQGDTTSGHRIRHESKTTIVALMRGGEPMAEGVNQALPGAMFLHAKRPDEVTRLHVRGQWTVVLVDSVVNSGKSMVDFVQRIRSLDPTIPIVAVAGVVQKQSLSAESVLGRALETDRALSLVALRLSENKFQGRGGTDTGNRLFNTTQFN